MGVQQMLLGRRRSPPAGTNLVLNGGFSVVSDWVLDGGWSYSASAMDRSNTGTISGVRQVLPDIVAGASYQIQFNVTRRASGTVRVNIYGSGGSSSAVVGSGISLYSGSVVAPAGAIGIQIESDSANWSGAVDNVALIVL